MKTAALVSVNILFRNGYQVLFEKFDPMSVIAVENWRNVCLLNAALVVVHQFVTANEIWCFVNDLDEYLWRRNGQHAFMLFRMLTDVQMIWSNI